ATNTDSREPAGIRDMQGLWWRPDTRADMQLQTVAHTESRRRRDAHPIDQRQTSGKVNTPRNDSHATSRAPGPSTQWGDYESAIRQWEQRLGRIAPPPTELSAKGKPQLSTVFVEWMMRLNPGHVTSIDGISRSNQLKMLGYGVVPQQALAALKHMQGGHSWTTEQP